METSVLTESAFDSDEPPPASLREKPLRRITFNGKPLTAQQQRCLESLELSLGLKLPDRDYWCDRLELWADPGSRGTFVNEDRSHAHWPERVLLHPAPFSEL